MKMRARRKTALRRDPWGFMFRPLQYQVDFIDELDLAYGGTVTGRTVLSVPRIIELPRPSVVGRFFKKGDSGWRFVLTNSDEPAGGTTELSDVELDVLQKLNNALKRGVTP